MKDSVISDISDYHSQYSRNTPYQNTRYCMRNYSVENYMEINDYIPYFSDRSMSDINKQIKINFNSIFPDVTGRYHFTYIPQEQDFNPFYRFHITDFDKNNKCLLFFYLAYSYFQDKTQDFEIGATEFEKNIYAQIESKCVFEEDKKDKLNDQNIRNHSIDAEKKGILKRNKKKFAISKINDGMIKNLFEDNFQDFFNFLNFMGFVAPVGFLAKRIESYYSYTDKEKIEIANNIFRFKNTFYVRTLDDNITVELLEAMHNGQYVEFGAYEPEPYITRESEYPLKAIPITIMVSSKTGKRYAVFYDEKASENEKLFILRLDKITDLICIPKSPFATLDEYKILRQELLSKNLTWGTRVSSKKDKEKVKITFRIRKGEEHSLKRLQREKRIGTITHIEGSDDYVYETLVEDSREMQSWLKTYIKRIVKIECSDSQYSDSLDKKFMSDFLQMCSHYKLEDLDTIDILNSSKKSNGCKYDKSNSITNKKFHHLYGTQKKIEKIKGNNYKSTSLVDVDINTDIYDVAIKYLMRDVLKPNIFYTARDIYNEIIKYFITFLSIDVTGLSKKELAIFETSCWNIFEYLKDKSFFNIYFDKKRILEVVDKELQFIKKTSVSEYNSIVGSHSYVNLTNDVKSNEESKKYFTLINLLSFCDSLNCDYLKGEKLIKSELDLIKYSSNIKLKIHDDISRKIHFGRYDIPFSYSEKSWLLATLEMPMARLFISDKLINTLKQSLIDDNVQPLFTKDDFYYYDQSLDRDFPKDDDKYNESYINNYRQILHICTQNASSGLYEKSYANISYGKKEPRLYMPLCLEHDLYGNKTRAFCANIKYLYSSFSDNNEDKEILKMYQLNMHKVSTVAKADMLEKVDDYIKNIGLKLRSATDSEIVINNITKSLTNPYVLFVELKDDGRDAITRLLTEFSAYKQRVVRKSSFDQEEKDKYFVSIIYPKDDLKQIVIKMLSFGPTVRIIDVDSLLEDFGHRTKHFKTFIEEVIYCIKDPFKKEPKTLNTRISKYRNSLTKQQNEFYNEYISRLKDQIELMNSIKKNND